MKARLRLEALDGRELPSVTVGDPAEAFSWVLLNELRRDPAGFAHRLNGLVNGTVPAAFGYSRTDPVVSDLRRLIGSSTWPAHYGQSLRMLRSSPQLGPLGWDDVLEDRAGEHVDWMRTHSFEHTGQDHPGKSYLPGYRTGYRGGAPDDWGYEPGRYFWWGEDIGYTYGLLGSSKAAYAAGRIGTIGFQERAAFLDTICYVIEVNSPSMAHLHQLLRPDAAPDGGSPHFNAIGMDVDFYEGPNEVRDGVGEATLSTHRFGLYRPGGSGGFLAGVVFRDGNRNGFFDAGEGASATVTVSGPVSFTESLDRFASHGVFSRYVPNGTYTVSGTAWDGTPLGSRTVTINNSNGWFDLRTGPSGSATAQAEMAAPGGSGGLRPSFHWTPVPDVVRYVIRLADRTAHQSSVFPGARSNIPGWTPPKDLIPGHSYRLLVRANLPDRDSPWKVFDFRVPAPTLSGPVGDVATARPTFSWSAVQGAAAYVVVVDDLTTGRPNLYRQQVSGTSWAPPNDLVAGHRFQWRVLTLNSAGQAGASPAKVFELTV